MTTITKADEAVALILSMRREDAEWPEEIARYREQVQEEAVRKALEVAAGRIDKRLEANKAQEQDGIMLGDLEGAARNSIRVAAYLRAAVEVRAITVEQVLQTKESEANA